MSMKNPHDTIGDRTRDLPACSALPQPTAPPRSSIIMNGELEMISKVETVYSLCKMLFVIFFLGGGGGGRAKKKYENFSYDRL